MKPAIKKQADVAALRADFPIFDQMRNGKPVAFLDSAASAQKPRAVIDAMSAMMETHYANIHRGLYAWGAESSAAYEQARRTTARFLNAASDNEIVFTRNATEAINLVASSWGGTNLTAGDEVIVTGLEHHANIVPWMMLKEKKGVVIRVVPVVDGALDMAAFESLLSDKTKLVAVTHMSNVLGTVTDIRGIVQKAKSAGAVTLVDGSQAAVHFTVDVQDIGCDFYVVTGHKLYGPTGIGALYGRAELLEAMPPYQGGGEMIEQVSFEMVTYREPPLRFEAGTPAIVEAVGLGAALSYLGALDRDAVEAHESALLAMADKEMAGISGVTVYPGGPQRAGLLSFNVDGVHAHDVATIFDQMGVAVRAGHHCAQPLMKILGVPATARASFGLYNTQEDVERLVEGVHKVKKLFQ